MKISAIITRPFFKNTKYLVLALFFIASMIAGSKTFAQNEDAPKDRNEAPAINQHGEQNDDDPMGKRPGQTPEVKNEPEIMAEHLSKMLTERLNLTTQQKTNVYNTVLDYASTHDPTTFSYNELDIKIEGILTTEQKDKYREYIKTEPERNTNIIQHGIDDAQPVK